MSEKTIIKSSHIEEIKISQEQIFDPLPNAPLVTFDLNLNNLQEFLNKVSALVNKNTTHISILSEEIKKKLSFPEGFDMLEGIALSVPNDYGGKKPKTREIKEGISAASQGIQGICEKIKDLHDFRKETNKKIEKLENLLESKLSQEKFEKEKKTFEDKISKKLSKKNFEKKFLSLEADFKQSEKNLLLKVAETDKTVSELEVNTL